MKSLRMTCGRREFPCFSFYLLLMIGMLLAGCTKKYVNNYNTTGVVRDTVYVTPERDTLQLGDLEIYLELLPSGLSDIWASYVYLVPTAGNWFGEEYARMLKTYLFAFHVCGLPKGSMLEMRFTGNDLAGSYLARVQGEDEMGWTEIKLDMPWNYDALRRYRKSGLMTFCWEVSVDGTLLGTIPYTCRVRRINECLKELPLDESNPVTGRFTNRSGNMVVSPFFTAWIEPENPLCDRVLSGLISSGLLDGINGYQFGEEDVKDQLWAVWYFLEQHGIRYANSTYTPGSTWGQEVRFIGEVYESRLAYCVEISVLLASIYLRMDLDVSLLTLPDHMYLVVKDAVGNPVYAIDGTGMGDWVAGETLTEAERRAASKVWFMDNLDVKWKMEYNRDFNDSSHVEPEYMELPVREIHEFIPPINSWEEN